MLETRKENVLPVVLLPLPLAQTPSNGGGSSENKIRNDNPDSRRSQNDIFFSITRNGQIKGFRSLADSVHAANALVAVSTDLLALNMGGECSADIVSEILRGLVSLQVTVVLMALLLRVRTN